MGAFVDRVRVGWGALPQRHRIALVSAMVLGAAVVIEAKHLCMMMRGVQKQNSVTTTSAFDGELLNNHITRNEFLKLIAADLS